MTLRPSIPGKILPWSLVALLFGLLAACGGRSQVATVANVHVAGWESNGTTQVAKYWKNGKGVDLTDGSRGALATAIVLQGSDVYIAGGQSNGSHDVATYWKNGQPVALTDGTHQAFLDSIQVAGGDVYASGYEDRTLELSPGVPAEVSVAKVWKNGTPTSLTDGSNHADARALAVSRGEALVGGWEYVNHQVDPNHFYWHSDAMYWKGGTKSEVTDGTKPSGVLGMALDGADVYLAGTEDNDVPFPHSVAIAKYWRNGVAVALTDGALPAIATCIAISGGDVYVAGGASNGAVDVATYWKNGVAHALTDGRTQSFANAIAVVGGDIYVVGYEGSMAVLWKNGSPSRLTDGRNQADARGIVVTVEPAPQ